MGTPTLDLGPGRNLRGDVGLDAFPMVPNVVQHRLTEFPWPFDDSSFGRVYAYHVLEHIPWSDAPDHEENLTRVMREVHRVLSPGGVLEIEVPHPANAMGYEGIPTHRRFFNEHSFRYYAGVNGHGSRAGFEASLFRSAIVWIERRFPGHWWLKVEHPGLYRSLRTLRFGRPDAIHVELLK